MRRATRITNVLNSGRHGQMQELSCLREPDATGTSYKQSGPHHFFELA